jgi:hypothetical protein
MNPLKCQFHKLSVLLWKEPTELQSLRRKKLQRLRRERPEKKENKAHLLIRKRYSLGPAEKSLHIEPHFCKPSSAAALHLSNY